MQFIMAWIAIAVVAALTARMLAMKPEDRYVPVRMRRNPPRRRR